MALGAYMRPYSYMYCAPHRDGVLHLSRLESDKGIEDRTEIEESFPDEQLLAMEAQFPWYADFVNYLACNVLPPGLSSQQKKKFLHDVKLYQWDNPLLFKIFQYQVMRRCVPQEEQLEILSKCHSSVYGGHFGSQKIAQKVLKFGFFLPNLFKDSHQHIQNYDRCQRVCNISRRNEMPLNNIQEVEIFDVWGIYFMGPFPPSFRILYILLVVDYVLKWVEAISTKKNDAKTVVKFVHRNILTQFGAPRCILSDEGIHFCNRFFTSLLGKYNVRHAKSLPYHPQSYGQAEISNREIKAILEKTVSLSRNDWSKKLDDAL